MHFVQMCIRDRVYALRPKKALLTAPTFAEYEEALRQTDTECIFYEMQPDLQIREDILDEMDSSLDVMFVCNPNNPTGILTPRSLLDQILKKAEVCGILLVLDECFLDFTDQESQSLISQAVKSQHLFILKSFTKMYAIPGIQMCIRDRDSIKLIANNKKAYHDYFIEDTWETGISLHGTEVKSLRMGKCSIKESFVRIEKGEVFVYGMHISPYEKGNIFNLSLIHI